MKYETTRPISAKLPRQRIASANHRRPAPTSAGLHSSGKTAAWVGVRKISDSSDNLHTPKDVGLEYGDENIEYDLSSNNADSSTNGQNVQFAQNNRDAPVMHINIKTPESVVRYEDDVKRMKDLEGDIRRTTLQLQKKLGIDINGLV